MRKDVRAGMGRECKSRVMEAMVEGERFHSEKEEVTRLCMWSGSLVVRRSSSVCFIVAL